MQIKTVSLRKNGMLVQKMLVNY